MRRIVYAVVNRSQRRSAAGSSPRPTLTNRSTNPSRQPTGRHFEPAPSPSIGVSLPTLLPKRQIPKRYTCEGADVSLPARWSGIPRNASELAVFVVNLQPTDGKLFFDWAVAGLSPVSRGIFAGGLPPGVIVGRNSSITRATPYAGQRHTRRTLCCKGVRAAPRACC